MASVFRRGLIGLMTGGWLISCQPTALSPETDIDLRPIEHAMGTTQIPVSPKRVVVLDYAPLDAALALNVRPVGRADALISPIYPEVIHDIPSVGRGSQPNLETILKLKPDLILGSTVGTDAYYYQRLSSIAPTLLTRGNGRFGDWQEYFLFNAEALGELEQAEKLLTTYHRRVEALKSKLDQVPQNTRVSVMTRWSGGILAYTSSSFSGEVLQDLGFERNLFQDTSDDYALKLSKEELTAIDGDVLFLMYNPDSKDSIAMEDFVSDPLWSMLNAVRQGVVCEVSNRVWLGGRSILAANQILSDVETCLYSGETEKTTTVNK
ncbi:MAG: iron-siderophore ABC transporter substrate-binding protein [Cyanobacteria bacterium P01_F01_bin.13]